MTDTEDC